LLESKHGAAVSAIERSNQLSTFIASPSVEAAAFIIHALRAHAEMYRRNGATVPLGVKEIESHLANFSVTRGQQGPHSAHPPPSEQIEPMKLRLVRYETAAELLDISVSTLKRRIAAGDFHPISIGGATRLRVAELDEFIANQTQETA